nr:cytochrome c oxidase subunit II [Methylobrevis pamukkalensis]
MQSMLDPAGIAATRIADLFWVMLIGAAVIWCLVISLAVYASRLKKTPVSERTALRLIIGAGVVFPTVVLTALLVYGLRLMPELRTSDGDLTIAVTGEQFWWRVEYRLPDGRVVPSANELRMPAGATVEVVLGTADVIHSFWIPALAGKTDMIPGRTTRQMLKPERPGIYRGACAEFCGSSHSLMAMTAVVMEPEAFAAWIEREAADAVPSGNARGREVFMASGCSACHTVRGTEAAGRIGPDLTHLGGRESLGAGILPNQPDAIARFVAETDRIKPGARMPAFPMLPEDDLAALAAWLGGLE